MAREEGMKGVFYKVLELLIRYLERVFFCREILRFNIKACKSIVLLYYIVKSLFSWPHTMVFLLLCIYFLCTLRIQPVILDNWFHKGSSNLNNWYDSTHPRPLILVENEEVLFLLYAWLRGYLIWGPISHFSIEEKLYIMFTYGLQEKV